MIFLVCNYQANVLHYIISVTSIYFKTLNVVLQMKKKKKPKSSDTKYKYHLCGFYLEVFIFVQNSRLQHYVLLQNFIEEKARIGDLPFIAY